MAEHQALTAYGVLIPKAFADRRDALAWAEREGPAFPGCKIVALTKTGPRTVWRHVPRGMAA